jgi:protein-L-isoaspartate(D-aspartate) O-methyltransferase
MIPSRGPSSPDEDRRELVERLRRRLELSPATVAAMRAVPRHEFVPDRHRGDAYDDRPLPIGDGQTVSAPHMVATMVETLSLSPGERVLEVGTGCGYHAAVTSEVVGADGVYTVEVSDRLAGAARERLDRLGYGAVSVRTGDGATGWPEHAPYDAAYLTCAAPDFPDAVLDQVRERGRLLAPLGDRRQRLVFARSRADGTLDREPRGGVRFVRMRGD